MLEKILPALLPSWRFFDYIAPSPRIEFRWQSRTDSKPHAWQAFRPLPERIPWAGLLRRLIWNPEWNESLFLQSCAEKILATESSAAAAAIHQYIARALQDKQPEEADTIVFRLRLLSRSGSQILEEIAYVSKPYRLPTGRHGRPE